MYASTTGVFNIYDYGSPDPTGATSSSDAIANAASAAGVNGGGIVFIPPGNYAIQYSIALPTNVQLVGSDQSDTSIMAMPNLRRGSGMSTALTTVMVSNSNNLPGGGSGQQSGIGVRDITFNGNATVLGQKLQTGSGSGAIIELSMVVDVTIQRCTIYNCQNHAITIDYVDNEGGSVVPGNIKILDNTIDVMATPGMSGVQYPTGNLSIRVTSYYNVIIRNNVIGYNPPAQLDWTPLWANDGIDVLHCSDVTVSGNQITLVTDGIGCDYGNNYVVTDNIIENYQGYGIRSERVTNAEQAVIHFVVAGNVVNASETSGTVSKAGIHVSAGLPQSGHDYPTSHHFAVAGNTVIGPTSQGGIICGASFGACTGNSVNLGSSFAPSVPQIGMLISGSNLTVTGNEVFDSSGAQQPTSIGIQLMSDQQNLIQTISECVVNGNAVENAAIAIDINSDIYAVSISENNLTGNGVGIQIETGNTVSGCRFAGNLGWNPPPPSAITPPGYSTASTPNITSYDCMVYVAGTSLTSIKVNGNAIAWPSGTVKGPIGVHVPVNGTIQVGGSGGSWVWTPE